MCEADALVELLAERAEARVRELLEQARVEFYEAADRAFAEALGRLNCPFRGPAAIEVPQRDGCCHRQAG